jgi:hypothetical protein
MAHAEIPIKVTAWVDEGVVPLVEALNQRSGVLTVDSCEDDDAQGAYVLFRVRGSSEDATALARSLAIDLGRDQNADYLLQAEWRPGESEPLLALSCPPDQVGLLASLISAGRTTPSCDGIERTAPRSSTARPLHQPASP